MTATLEFCRRGVGAALYRFFSEIPVGAAAYWITYNVDPPPAFLKVCTERRISLRIVCKHPDGGPSLTPEAWQRVEKCRFATLRGYQDRQPLSDGEDPDPFGPLHAKLIVWHSRGRRGLATGSFNATRHACERGAEVVVIHHDAIAPKEAWKHAKELWERAVPIEESELHRSHEPKEWDFEELGAVDGAPADGRIRPTIVREPLDAIVDPKVIGRFCSRLDYMLKNYPQPGGDTQWQVLNTLWRRQRGRGASHRDILYLPVAVGKTFIALRWLCEHLRGARRGHVTFLAPNQWVQASVTAQIETVAREAGLDPDDVFRWIHVVRPAAASLDGLPEAVVADECHNWSSRGGATGSYTSALKPWLDRIPVLGLSATPCRMEDGRFDVPHFIETFLGRATAKGETAPFMSLEGARDRGFVCSASYSHLVDDATREQVKRLLTCDEGRLYEMGDYSSVTPPRANNR